MKEYFSTTPSQLVPRKIKEKIITEWTKFAALNNSLVHLLCGKHFVNFAQTVFDVGKSISKLANV